MSFWSSITDSLSKPLSYLYGEGGAITAGEGYDQTLAAHNQADYSPGGSIYNQIAATSGTSVADSTWGTVQQDQITGSTLNLVATGDANAAAASASQGDWGNVLMDVAILGAIVGGLWFFFKVGGGNYLKAKSNKKTLPWILAVGAIVAYLVYAQFKKTASDTTSATNNFTSSFKSVFGL